MLLVFLPVLYILLREVLRPDDKKVFRVLLFRGLREVEAARDHHGLVMCDRVCRIDERRNASMRREVGSAVFRCALGLIEDHRHPDAPLVSLDKGLCDGGRREGVRLDKDLRLCLPDGVDDSISTAAVRTEINLNFRAT
jgi:hypothetical protein